MTLSTNLIAYYSLDSVADALGSNSLTNNNGATFVSGKVGNAVSLASASSQYLSHAAAPAFAMGDIDFTITAWVSLTTKPGNVMGVLSKAVTTGNQRSYQLNWTNGFDRFRFVISSDGTSAGNVTCAADNFGAPTLGVFYFLAARYNAATDMMSLSVNNGTPNTATQVGGAFASTAPFEIGRIDAANLMNGVVDEVGIWKRTLTDVEITDLYNGGSGRDYAYISSGTAYTLTAARGTLTYTGQTTALAVGHKLTAVQGAYATTGQAATLLYTPVAAYTLSAQRGVYTLSGQSAAMLYRRQLLAGIGAYHLNGYPVILAWSEEQAPVTPPERTYQIAAEERVYVVAATERILVIG